MNSSANSLHDLPTGQELKKLNLQKYLIVDASLGTI